MKSAIALLALAVASATAFTPAIHPDMVEEINSKQSSWTAHMSPRFENKPIEHVEKLCGTFMDPEVVVKLPVRELVHPGEELTTFASLEIPDEFDSRTGFPECADVIGHVRDQANCGSCWAFGSTEAFNDRLCIASKGEFKTLLSPMDTVNCCGFLKCFSMGCNGGQPGMAWKFFKSDGVVTGGDYSDIDAGNTCLPYQFESCAHHVDDPTRRSCDETPSGKSMGCKKTCTESNYSGDYKSDKIKSDSSYSLSSVEQIQKDIMTYGPVSGAFTVYEDFPAYKSGVYHHTTGSQLGGHAIKIFGWGTENGEDYWLVMNSWNEMWGDNGTFKIKRGTNECGIEGGVNGGKVTYSAKL